jgi:hypothetical protein
VAIPSARLQRRIIADFGPEASEILEAVCSVPESLPLADKQDSERLQAALVMPARGSAADVTNRLRLARADWRDALVAAGLADGDWIQRLDVELGPGLTRRARVWAFLKRRTGTVALLALLVQPLAWATLAWQWVESRNVATGCRPDSVCADEGEAGPLMLGWVGLPLAELFVGVALWCWLCDDRRHRDDPLWVPPRPIAWTFITVTAILLAVPWQVGYVAALADETTPARARLAGHTIVYCTAADVLIAAALIALRVIRSRRRRRQLRARVRPG